MSAQDLRRALDLAQGRLPSSVLSPVAEALDRVEQRRQRDPDRTVAAFVGATGSGKSSLLNAVAGREVARVAATRPTTSQPLAVVWGQGASDVLDWLQVPERTTVPGPEGLVLVDLPDVDSVMHAHRETALRLSQAVDVIVWVLDPQKYADAVIHRDFLAQFAGHGAVTWVVLNQIDRVAPDDRARLMADVRQLMGTYGLEVVPASARTGEGVDALRDRLLHTAAGQRARTARAQAEVARAAEHLAEEAVTAAEVTVPDPAPLIEAATAAAGVRTVQHAVRVAAVRDGRAAVGWPVVRWLQKLRPDPLKRLHLERSGTAVASSLPGPTPVNEAAVRAAAYRLVELATRDLPTMWQGAVMQELDARVGPLVDSLDGAIAKVDLTSRRPAWWRMMNALQWLLLAAAVVGGLWLAALAGMAYLQLPAPRTPMWGPVPWPTVLLAGGLALGALLAALAMLGVRLGAARRERRIEVKLAESVRAAVDHLLLEPLERELLDYDYFREAVRAA